MSHSTAELPPDPLDAEALELLGLTEEDLANLPSPEAMTEELIGAGVVEAGDPDDPRERDFHRDLDAALEHYKRRHPEGENFWLYAAQQSSRLFRRYERAPRPLRPVRRDCTRRHRPGARRVRRTSGSRGDPSEPSEGDGEGPPSSGATHRLDSPLRSGGSL